MTSKAWYQSKLVWLGVAQLLGGLGLVAEALVKWTEGGAATNDLMVALIPSVTGLLTIVFRLITKQPIGTPTE